MHTTITKIIQHCTNDEPYTKETRYQLYRLIADLKKGTETLSVNDLKALLALNDQLSQGTNTKSRYLEEALMEELMIGLPIFLQVKEEYETPEEYRELLQEYYDEPVNEYKLKHSLLLKYAKEVILQEQNKSKRQAKRITNILRLLTILQASFQIPNIQNIYEDKLDNKDKDVQIFALVGLEEYYKYEESKKITKKLIKKLENLIKTTKYRINVVAACQILINSKIIDEIDALSYLDQWEENYK